MALQATHFRIAQALVPYIEIKNFDAYYSGTLYPDSRYLTGILREQTHGSQCPHNPHHPTATDFEKGWAVHLLYDEISGDMQKALMPKGMVLSQIPDLAWAYFTAIKVIEDWYSVITLGNNRSLLAKVTVWETPNCESREVLCNHYRTHAVIYREGSFTIDRYAEHFEQLHIPPASVEEIMRVVSKLSVDGQKLEEIDAIYTRTLKEIIERWFRKQF